MKGGNLQTAWNHWFHCMAHTYGTWLPGDPRGFRVRHHREHIEGDYKSPPPKGKFDGLHRYSKSVMRRGPVHLSEEQRTLVLRLLVESFLRREIEIVAACLDSVHFHILARFPDHRADHWVGVAKKEASHFAKEAGNCSPGGLWAGGGKCVPITDRGHQLATVRYILDHQKRAGAVWFRGRLVGELGAEGISSRGMKDV